MKMKWHNVNFRKVGCTDVIKLLLLTNVTRSLHLCSIEHSLLHRENSMERAPSEKIAGK